MTKTSFLAALLAFALAGGEAVSARERGGIYLAVPESQANAPDGAIRFASKTTATRAQSTLARKRVMAYLRRMSPAQRKAMRARAVRYICVTTTPSPGSKGRATCMAWDTQAQEFVGNNAYDLINPPPVGSEVQFPSFKAAYVGDGAAAASMAMF